MREAPFCMFPLFPKESFISQQNLEKTMDLTNNALTELTVQLSLDRARFCKSGSFNIFLQPFSKQRTALKKGRKLFNLFKTNIRCVFYIHLQAISKEKTFSFSMEHKNRQKCTFYKQYLTSLPILHSCGNLFTKNIFSCFCK